MNTYIAFLRGINVSGQKKIKMADLREHLLKYGLVNVVTYIQSGNIIFDYPVCDPSKIAQVIVTCIRDNFGFDVPTLIVLPSQLKAILGQNPFTAVAEHKNQYFALLYQPPSKVKIAAFNALSFENEEYHVTDSCVYLNCKQGAGKAKLNNNLIEQKLGVVATTRNLNTLNKMVELSS